MKNKKLTKLNHRDLAEVVKKTPLVSIDLIIENGKGRVLLGLRNNEPARNFWFVPGGRILKNELIAQALERITKEELGTNVSYKKANFVGVFEHFYPTNFAKKKGFGTHYVVLAHRILLKRTLPKFSQTQHSRYKWFSKTALLKEKAVHTNTKAYFK